MKTDKETEKLLLNDSEYDKIVAMKIEQEFCEEIKPENKKKETYSFNIKEIPPSKLFSKASVFEVLNKSSKTKSYINGIQAEGFLGTDTINRNKLLSGEILAFVSGNNYIKFIKCKI